MDTYGGAGVSQLFTLGEVFRGSKIVYIGGGGVKISKKVPTFADGP